MDDAALMRRQVHREDRLESGGRLESTTGERRRSERGSSGERKWLDDRLHHTPQPLMAEDEDSSSSMASLFEGMVLFNSSQIPDPIDPSPTSTSTPLDENLFSDLTLTSPSPQSPPATAAAAAAASTPPPPPEIPSGSRQISRRKKKGGFFRVGYGRDSTGSSFDEPISSSSSPIQSNFNSDSVTPKLGETPIDQPLSSSSSSSSPIQSNTNSNSNSSSVPPRFEEPPIGTTTSEGIESKVPTIESEVRERSSEIPTNEIEVREMGSVENDERRDGLVAESVSSEEKLEGIRGGVMEKIGLIGGAVSEVSKLRKEVARKRRKAAENVNLSAVKYRELEEELEEACEAEDFERADRYRDISKVVGSKRHYIHNLIFEAADNADLILKNAAEHSLKEMNEWSSSMEKLEIKKMELEIESHLINDTRLGLSDSINHAIENDTIEKELFLKKKHELTEDLEKLLALVREKEAEIAENDSHIAEVEKRIANVVSRFHEAKSSINVKYDDMQSVISMVDLECEALSTKKKEIDDFVYQQEKRGAMLRELASGSSNEARECQELVELRKSLALPIFSYREEKMKLAKTEEKIMEEVQTLRQEISYARISLQTRLYFGSQGSLRWVAPRADNSCQRELSSTRSRIQEEITSAKQRIFFIDKRSPELEAEKKVAAAARNFKEAARVAAEMKSLGVEKESIKNTMDYAILELEKMEEEINATVERLLKMEELILSKEREAAMAGFERLRLVSAAAMAERSAALDLGDDEEACTLHGEAEAANSEAAKLQEAYNLKEEDFGSMAKHLISIELIANLGRKQLAEMAKSVSLSNT
ncbi:hypothetical protein Syun_014839 [Stephania yunnanensis]|uniref:UVR domain-containing protein n=1 Tax=Stephania yunnanensis TaxID=152371 RepID=A0AAP0JKE9_9MAGN